MRKQVYLKLIINTFIQNDDKNIIIGYIKQQLNNKWQLIYKLITCIFTLDNEELLYIEWNDINNVNLINSHNNILKNYQIKNKCLFLYNTKKIECLTH